MLLFTDQKHLALTTVGRGTDEVKIRSYRESDRKECREIFTEGMQELVTLVSHVVFPRFLQYIALTTVLAIIMSIRWSIWVLIVDVFVAVVVLAVLYIDVYVECWKFINECLTTDLTDINKSYMSNEGSHLWVAEWKEKVVGMVGLLHNESHKPGVSELQRMSVASSCRKMGIGGKLLDAVLEHAQQQRIEKIILTTTSAQSPAIRLYKKYGFRLMTVFPYPQWILGDLEYWCFDLKL